LRYIASFSSWRSVFACAVLFTVVSVNASTYYVDCAAGADTSSGTSPGQPWKTLPQVNRVQLEPGDSILFKRGTSCDGMLTPRGSGSPAQPISIGAYGSGRLPVIRGGTKPAAIRLFNQQYWHIRNIEAVGGSPYGIFIGGSEGQLRDFQIKDVVVHDVSGEPKSKATGLVVFAAAEQAEIKDVLIDGITAYDTTEWAGIIVNGASPEHRIRNVIIRNSIVHHVYGDGIVMFYVEDGLIERSAAWLTGLQPEEQIGTPNAIWTWTCRRCTVRQTEGFFVDSPGVDGGVYDIDFGNDDNIVEDNYGHDAMGYCTAVFAAEKQVTTNSIIRGNLCIDNGRSPRLARRQGDLFVSTWDGGLLDGVRIENNTFYWSPLADTPAFLMDPADFTGTRPNVVTGNRIFTRVSTPIRASSALKFESNTVGPAAPTFTLGTVHSGRFRLVLIGADRGEVVFLEAALAQYPNRLEAVLKVPDPPATLATDWNLGRMQLISESGPQGLGLFAPNGKPVAQWSGFASPVKLGLALRRNLGIPAPFGAEAR
jgi:hypothetical protein